MCQILALFIICLGFVQDVRSGGGCSRIPKSAIGHRSAVDDNFKILIDGNPETYVPNYRYNVTLSCPINLKFSDFTLAVENEDQAMTFNGQDTTGHFELVNDVDTKFIAGCENIVESTNSNAKILIEVVWVAPSQPDSGCILIKAGVVQHRNAWFIDDGFLTKRICAEEIDELNAVTPSLQNCCACDEAKYEIVLERKWNKNTHPKNFPDNSRIGELIGASHTHSYRYWAYGELASEGMRKMAEHGATTVLEKEIIENTQNGEVRTMIKAPGIENRLNVFGTTLANARVDPKHHQISLAAKIEPSPDWVIGVAGMELCLSNCTWLERKVLNLYPWDIGTDAGPTYMAKNDQQVPPDVIRHISSSYPSDHRAPFFDETGAAMKPLATLYVTRKKLYIRDCAEDPQEGPLECATHPWIDWSNCSTRCGPGFSQRFRSFKNPILAANYNCDRQLEETRQCEGTECGNEEDVNNEAFDYNNLNTNANRNANNPDSMAKCQLTNWSSWSPCSTNCGSGIQNRTRDFYNQQAKMQCLSVVTLPLEETQPCIGTICGGIIRNNGESNTPSEYDTMGEISSNNEQNSWDSGSSQINNQNWNNNMPPPYPAENQRGFNDNRGQAGQARTPNYGLSNNYKQPNVNDNRGQADPSRTQNYGLNSVYSNDNRGQGGLSSTQSYNTNYNQPTFNDNRGQADLGRGQNYGLNSIYNPPNLNNNQRKPDYSMNPSYVPNNNWNENQHGIRQNYDLTNNPQWTSGVSTRAPYAVYSERLSDSRDNFKVVQDYCYEKPLASTEPCLANPVVLRNYWAYDHYGDQDDEGGKCKIFTTDNCDRNQNRFVTLEACEGTCILPMINQVRKDGPNNY